MLAPATGFEPVTVRLTVGCSAVELRRIATREDSSRDYSELASQIRAFSYAACHGHPTSLSGALTPMWDSRGLPPAASRHARLRQQARSTPHQTQHRLERTRKTQGLGFGSNGRDAIRPTRGISGPLREKARPANARQRRFREKTRPASQHAAKFGVFGALGELFRASALKQRRRANFFAPGTATTRNLNVQGHDDALTLPT